MSREPPRPPRPSDSSGPSDVRTPISWIDTGRPSSPSPAGSAQRRQAGQIGVVQEARPVDPGRLDLEAADPLRVAEPVLERLAAQRRGEQCGGVGAGEQVGVRAVDRFARERRVDVVAGLDRPAERQEVRGRVRQKFRPLLVLLALVVPRVGRGDRRPDLHRRRQPRVIVDDRRPGCLDRRHGLAERRQHVVVDRREPERLGRDQPHARQVGHGGVEPRQVDRVAVAGVASRHRAQHQPRVGDRARQRPQRDQRAPGGRCRARAGRRRSSA